MVRPSDTPSANSQGRDGGTYSAAFSVDICRDHADYCKTLTISELPTAGRTRNRPTVLHDWAADLVVHPGMASAELAFGKGLDTYVAAFSPLQAVARLKAVSDQITSSQRGMKSINPSRFYGGTGSPARGVLKAFHRQDDAFEFCDNNKDIDLKVFCFESEAMMGRRRFVAAEVSEFVQRYSAIAPLERHVYEIIREGYPCRIYLDLEFAKDFNLDANGEAMVQKVVQMLCWKLYEMFGIVVGPEDIIDLDSSNEKKFSRHITVILPASALNRWDAGNGFGRNSLKRDRYIEREEVESCPHPAISVWCAASLSLRPRGLTHPHALR